MSESQPVVPAQPLSPADEKLWSTLAHIGNIIGFLPSLLILLILGPRSAKVRAEAKEALNFVITMTAIWIVLAIVSAILLAVYLSTPTSGLDVVVNLLRTVVSLAQWAAWILLVVFSIIAGVRVNGGGSYRYPFAIRLVK